MEPYNNYNNGEYTPNHYDDFQDGFQSYDDMSNGFGSGNPVKITMQQIRTLMYEEVIAKAFLFMVAALGITAFAAYTAPYFMLNLLMSSPSAIFILFGAELAIVIISNLVLKRNHGVLAAVLYTVYSYLTGATIGIICLAYTGASVAAVFLMTAGMFGVMAIYGLITKRDLSSIGSLLMMGLVGIIIAGLVNIFILRSSALEFGISIVGVLVFVGLTAYDAQKLKDRVAYSDSDSSTAIAMAGAFELYLDFINLFLKLLRLFGRRK